MVLYLNSFASRVVAQILCTHPSNQLWMGHQQLQSFNLAFNFCINWLTVLELQHPTTPSSSQDRWEPPHFMGVGEIKVSPCSSPEHEVSRNKTNAGIFLFFTQLSPMDQIYKVLMDKATSQKEIIDNIPTYFTMVDLLCCFQEHRKVFPDWTLMFKMKHSLYSKLVGTTHLCDAHLEINQYSGSR